MSKFPLRRFHDFTPEEAKQLLYNKFVVILGDSIHRSIYKDLICFLHKGELLSFSEIRNKGEETVFSDHKVEGGEKHKRTDYREVRQYRKDHHLIRAYFLTRVYSAYMESILSDFRAGPTPDLIILNSCLWDLNRYLDDSSSRPLEKAFREYRQNLQTLFQKLHDILPPTCLVIWNTAMPVATSVKNAYLEKGMKNRSTPEDVMRANFDSATLACCYQFDILDLHFSFRFLTRARCDDGVHWNQLVHRFITKLLLTHVADAWGVRLKMRRPQRGIPWKEPDAYQRHPPQHLLPPAPWCPPPPEHTFAPPQHLPAPLPPALWSPPPPEHTFARGHLPPPPNYFSHDVDFRRDFVSSIAFSNFEDDSEPPAYLKETQHGGFYGPTNGVPAGRWGVPHHPLPPYDGEDVPDRRRRGRRAPYDRPHRAPFMHDKRFRPYHHNGPSGHLPLEGPPYRGPRGW